nr:MAG TPA: hypothetical protein [Caudoviricetes sp.]
MPIGACKGLSGVSCICSWLFLYMQREEVR